tara:strand:+ start:444 stop:674 length:231 start_codon:yes stop_codon:yes gene_type:complete
MKHLLISILKALVDSPSKVKVTQIPGKKTIMYELRCDKKDIGKIIGKSGKTVGAIRTLFNALSSKKGKRVIVEVVD